METICPLFEITRRNSPPPLAHQTIDTKEILRPATSLASTLAHNSRGIPSWAPTIADLLKQQGFVTGQLGKNHLGDRDEHLPIVHGFDEFLGNLYHLNAEEEPEKELESLSPPHN